MITDQLVNFLPPSSNLAVTNATVYSNVIDLLGVGVGVTPSTGNVIIGRASLFGQDPGGAGIVVPELICAVGTAFSGSGTLTMQFQGAIDDGTGNPSTYQVFNQTAAMTIAQLTAGAFFGRTKWPFEFPDGFNPRFLRLAFVPSSTFTGGTVAYALVTMGPSVQFNKYAASNFTVAG